MGVGMVQEAGGAQPRGVEQRASVSTITAAQMSASAWRETPALGEETPAASGLGRTEGSWGG